MARILALFLCSAFALLTASCGMFTHESVGTETLKDSTTYSERGTTCTVLLDVDYPDGGDPLMVRSVKQWMGGLLNLTDTTAMAGVEKFAEAFFKQNETGKEMLKDHPEGYRYELTVRKVDETGAYVTFVITTQTKEGAQTTATRIGATFMKPTGKIFGYGMFVEDKPRSLAVMVMRGLQEHFKADDFATLTKYINASCFSPSDQGVAELPELEPWIESDEVVFQYAQNELQGDSLLLPQARVPIGKANEFFSPDFRRALEEAVK